MAQAPLTKCQRHVAFEEEPTQRQPVLQDLVLLGAVDLYHRLSATTAAGHTGIRIVPMRATALRTERIRKRKDGAHLNLMGVILVLIPRQSRLRPRTIPTNDDAISAIRKRLRPRTSRSKTFHRQVSSRHG